MRDKVRINLQPLGKTLEVGLGTPLQDVLFSHGVEFPCGGCGRCRGCRVRVIKGSLPVTPEQQQVLTPGELSAGWRLACQSRAESDLTLELPHLAAVILADDSKFEFEPAEGLGIAVDLGTTTLVAQLLDLRSGHVLAVETGLNPQARHGSDVMSRVQLAATEGGLQKLRDMIRKEIGTLISNLLASAHAKEADLRAVTIVGNTVMHHLFCGIDIEPLSRYPFNPVQDGMQVFRAGELGWNLASDPEVRYVACLGGFVGSDALAGILATRIHESEQLVGLIDLGTNGEIVFGNSRRILCASAAAGPAFEGARITMGMQAATGAIWKVAVRDGKFVCRILGNVEPRGICGSGLVDAVAAGLELGLIDPSGRITGGMETLEICAPVSLTGKDIRELQLAKAAIAAGVRILLKRLDATPDDVSKLYLAGAFGNYIDPHSARRIGLLDFPAEKVHPAGNTALLGAKIALFLAGAGKDAQLEKIRNRVEHVSLSADPDFQNIFAEEMSFTATSEA